MRVFFALWPTAEAARDLHAVAAAAGRECGGRAMRRDTLHLTLAFVGEVADDRLPDLLAAAATVAGERFELVLDRLVWWRHNRILWAGCRETPDALAGLAGGLAAALRAAGFPIERRPFAAHLTLVRDCPGERLPGLAAPVGWPAAEFVLVRSRRSAEGSRYEILGRWPLAGGAPAGLP